MNGRPPIPPRNALVLAGFFGLLVATIAAAAYCDALVMDRWGAGATISWGMALLAEQAPFVSHSFAFFAGLICGGLLVHFFAWRQMSPAEAAELDHLRAEVERRAPAE